MAASIDTLNFLAPGLASVSEPDKTKALELAAAFRPDCLSEEKQDLAQTYYAIYLLYDRKRQTAGEEQGITVAPADVKSIKEGDVMVTFSEPTAAGVIPDPSGYYAKWVGLNNICKRGAIIASDWRCGNACC